MIRKRQVHGLTVETQVQVEDFEDQLIVPYRPAPVMVGRETRIMKFSMVPSWSKDAKVKFATHNARLESIDEKPTWKTVFTQRHCLVPMTDFIEPIYEGEFAGNMVAFSAKDNDIIFAAGVWDEWVNRETGEVTQSFAIITQDPPPFVANTGHDRCPVFLERATGEEWLRNIKSPPNALKAFLQENTHTPDFKAIRHRPMRPGWEKRK